jgi:transposase
MKKTSSAATAGRKKYVVKLRQEERNYLLQIVSKGKASAKKLTHARILLQADESEAGKHCEDNEIADILDLSTKTIYRVRQRFVEESIESALNRKPHKRYKPRRLDGEQEAKLIALACSKAPEGRSRWTLKLLAEKMVELEIIESVGATTIHETLKKTNLSLG